MPRTRCLPRMMTMAAANNQPDQEITAARGHPSQNMKAPLSSNTVPAKADARIPQRRTRAST